MLNFNHKNKRDALHLGTCDDAILDLCKMLDWEKDLEEISNKNKIKSKQKM